METVKVTLEVISVFSFRGSRKAYKLPDMSYAEWLVTEKGYPKYYFPSLDKIYEPYLDQIRSRESIEKFLEEQFKKHEKPFQVRRPILEFGNLSKAYFETFELEKLPIRVAFIIQTE